MRNALITSEDRIPRSRGDVFWLRSLLLGLILMVVPQGPAAAQEAGPGTLSPGTGTSVDALETSSELGEQIIDILQSDPTLLMEIQKHAAKRWEDLGFNVQDQDISDEAIYEQIRKDPFFRLQVAKELNRQGYLDFRELSPEAQSELQSLSSGGGISADQGRDQQRDEETSISREQASRPRPARRPAPRPSEQERPVVVRKRSPYTKLPSLYDLYAQVPAHGQPLARFGTDVFRNGSGNYDRLPMDLPVGPEYVIGPGDSLTVDMWGGINQRLRRVVDREGRVALPEVGTVLVAGRSLRDAQKDVEAILALQFSDIRADVSLARLRSVRVYVVGDVEQPGPYDISSLSTALNAIYLAGGPTARGSMRAVRHYRGKELVRQVDLYDLILRGIRSDVQPLQAGDTILVPPIGPQVTVEGMVRRPAIYEIQGEKSLADALELAGGVLITGSLRQLRVERIEAHQKRVTLNFELPDSSDSATQNAALASSPIRDGDIITVSPILPYSERTVYLDGHVFRPGKYPYEEGMRAGGLVRGYRDVLPEPADRAEIVRLEPPEFRPVVIPFPLTASLDHTADDPPLRPFDTVRVYGRYEFDPPKVHIYGEVLRPGEYPLSQGMTASELVRMAGGFRRSALTERADLTSYAVKRDQQVVGETQEIDMARALAGNPGADVALKNGDILTVRQLAGWSDIGSSITINGEVLYPGTYGFRDGERLSSVIRRAGGFRATAYPRGAVLEREQVRRIAEKSKAELVRRLQQTEVKVAPAGSSQEVTAQVQAFVQQRNQAIERLQSAPANARQVIRISTDIGEWENTPADIELRAGDALTVPKTPTFVLIQGQVNNPSAITFSPGRSAKWYLENAGGPTEMANRKEAFIIRADGTVIGRSSGTGWWSSKGDVLSTRLAPGDSIVIPEKVITGSNTWRTLIQAAQVSASIGIVVSALAK